MNPFKESVKGLNLEYEKAPSPSEFSKFTGLLDTELDFKTLYKDIPCQAACPVDAILGASKMMHTVIAHECTGCDLCIAPCPVDCIDMLPREPQPRWTAGIIASDRTTETLHGST